MRDLSHVDTLDRRLRGIAREFTPCLQSSEYSSFTTSILSFFLIRASMKSIGLTVFVFAEPRGL